MEKRERTRTSSFGVSGRRSHDSTPFYRRSLYSNIPSSGKTSSPISFNTQAIPSDVLDHIICADSRDLSMIPDSSVHLMVTSPPYGVGKAYDEDMSLDAYRELLVQVMQEVYRVLVPGGRACINIADVGRRPMIPLHAYLTLDMIERVGFLFRGTVIWDKGSAVTANSFAFGTYQSPRNPVLRDEHEYILVFSKQEFSRIDQPASKTMDKQRFMTLTRSIWHFAPESAKRVGHPAPFPIELPKRLIELYSYPGDVVLDPFVGSGTTCVAAIRLGRHYIGIDNQPKYVELARRRVQSVQNG